MRRKKKILKVTTGLGPGGGESQLVQLAIRLGRKGWEVAVVSMLFPTMYTEDLQAEGIKVWSLGMVRGRPSPLAVLKLAALVKGFRPEIVHSHMIHANLLTRIVRLLAPVPVLISTAHSTLEVGRSFRTERSTHLVYRWTDFLADMTTQVAREGYERFLKGKAAKPGKLAYIPNGVDTDRFALRPEIRGVKRNELGVNEEDFLWLTVGRLEEVKDYPTLLRAFASLTRRYAKARLLIVGQGSLEGEIKGLVSEMGLGDKVRFLGLRRDVPELMNAADAYVMSSLWEGMPMVLLEAHASGLPIVATDVGDNREVVREGVSGYLVPPKDPLALGSAMERVMNMSADNRIAMGLEGRRWVVENFSLDKIVDRWESLYLKLLSQKGLARVLFLP